MGMLRRITFACALCLTALACREGTDSIEQTPESSKSAISKTDKNKIVLHGTSIDGVVGFENVFFENGYRYLFLVEDCRYWTYKINAKETLRGWEDVYTGQLDEAECTALSQDLSVDAGCHFYHVTGITDLTGTNSLVTNHGALACTNAICQDPEDSAKLLETSLRWQEILIEMGSPVQGKLRGLLVVDRREIDLPKYALISDELKKHALPDDDFRYMTCFSLCGEGPFDTMLFPDEVQDELWELRRQHKAGEFLAGVETDGQVMGIPLKDAAGQKYQLFVRPVTELEDENGVIPRPLPCDGWKDFYFDPPDWF